MYDGVYDMLDDIIISCHFQVFSVGVPQVLRHIQTASLQKITTITVTLALPLISPFCHKKCVVARFVTKFRIYVMEWHNLC